MSIKNVLLIILGVIVAAFVGIFILPWVFLAFGTTFLLPNPPMPEIRYGEFPFRLEYEINGERIVVEDTIICKFDGVGAGTNGKYLKWDSFLVSGKKPPSKSAGAAMPIDEENNLYFSVGSAEYYMGVREGAMPSNLHAVRFGNGGAQSVFEDELLTKYGIRLLSWEPSAPIQNTFK